MEAFIRSNKAVWLMLIADFLAVLPHAHSIRRMGSTALNLAYLACGRLHAFWVRRICCWDAAAGILIAREAGCAVRPFQIITLRADIAVAGMGS
jgi:fructose-1,6-bisphosphatase/inositol monophosphatase family enzyme